MKINNDYRNTDQCPTLIDVATKKSILENAIKTNSTKTRIVYNKIKDKQDVYYNEFAKIYNYKCAYCGTSVKFTNIQLFEVDHYICESAFSKDTPGRAEAGKIENLTFSCYSCNRGKGSLHIMNGHIPMLNPDDNSISDLFCRDNEYYIKIHSDYSSDRFIQSFYTKLKLESEFRRLDFLLLEMDSLVKKVQSNNEELAQKLEQCMNRLKQKKNCTLG